MARVIRAAGERKVSAAAVLLALVAGLLFWNMAANRADATHEPANKVAASTSNVRDIDGQNGNDLVIVEETLRVSSTSDLILSATSECALITSVTTGEEAGDQTTDSASARAAIDYYITIDGQRVPVESTDGDATKPGHQPADSGDVVFCDRLYTQTARDAEGDGDIDQMDSYIESRTANGFNWVAFDAGKNFDANGDNVLDIELHAHFTESTEGTAAADAFVGRTSLVIEPTVASTHETT